MGSSVSFRIGEFARMVWGLREIATYLHGGRAATLEQAILAHDGQGRNARDRFAALGSGGEQLMYAFLNSL
jgi:CxxC motif-containing protein (DUF1111 family)